MSWIDRYHRDGFAVIPQLIDPDEIARLMAAIGLSGDDNPGHALRNLFDRVPAARNLAESSMLRELAAEALGGRPSAIRGLYFDKTPDANWLVPWHQDLTIAVTEKRDVAGFGPWSTKQEVVHVQPPEPWLSRRFAARIHLDDCGADNGPLRVMPGTHRHGRLSGAEIDGLRGECAEMTVMANAGDVLLMSPMLVHASSAARTPAHRRVIHFEYACDPLPDGLEWYEAVHADFAS